MATSDRKLPPGVYPYEVTRAGKKRTQFAIKFQHTVPGQPAKAMMRRQGRPWGDLAGQAFLTQTQAKAERDAILAEIREGHPVGSRPSKYAGPGCCPYIDNLAAAEAAKSPPRAVDGPMTVGQWLDTWLASLRKQRESTLAGYRKAVRVHLNPRIGHLPLAELTGAQITAMYLDLEKNGRSDGKGGLSASTVLKIHVNLSQALKQAVLEGLISANPADRSNPPSAKEARPKDEIHPWTAQQLDAFLRFCADKGVTNEVAYRLAAFTGLRRGELLALQWRDLDLDKSTLAVRRSVSLIKEPGRRELVVGPPKSGKERVVNLDPDTVDLLRKWRLERAKMSLQLVRNDAVVFGTIQNAFQDPDHFSQSFDRQVARCRTAVLAADPEAEFPRIRLHDVRHTHATLMLKAGVPVKVVSERLGHASVTITLNIYAHVLPGMQAEAAALFAAAVKGGA